MDKWADREWVAWVNQLGNRVAKLEHHIANRALAFACGMGRASDNPEITIEHVRDWMRAWAKAQEEVDDMQPVYDAARNFIRLSLDPAWTSADVDQVESIKAKMAEAFNDLQSLLKDSIQAEAAASSQQTEP